MRDFNLNIDRLVIWCVLVALAVNCVDANKTVSYCDLCDEYNHIACDHKGSFGVHCSSDRELVEMDTSLKNFIVQMHNQLRNEVALGKLPNYKPAERMAFVQWDDELAYLAELNARRCYFDHDECRNTKHFPFAGQNIARKGNSKRYLEVWKSVKEMIIRWYNEYEDCDMSYINAYQNHPTKIIGHFTAIVGQKVNRVGCALVKHQEGIFKYLYLVCNYSYTNVIEEAVYTAGKTCSKCETGCHKVYKGLCSAKELIRPLPNGYVR